MATPDEVRHLHQRLTRIARVGAWLSANAEDLHSLAHDPPVRDHERVKGVNLTAAPRGGDPRALAAWTALEREIAKIEASLAGFQRGVTALFNRGYGNPEPSRGTLHSRAEHQQLLAAQRRRRNGGGYSPERNMDQPPHPSRKR